MRFLILFLSAILISFSAHAEDKLSIQEQGQVRDLVRETILANPEILVEAMNILQKRQEQAQKEQQKNILASLDGALITKATPIAGNPKGDVTLIEFFDYQCGYCKRAFPGVMKVINADKNIKYVLKEFAILGPNSEIAARAALAAKMQGKYMEFHTEMMTVRGRLTENKIIKTAASLGLDTDKLKADMKSDAVNQEINSTREIARALNITGTPAFIIGDQIIPGAVPPAALISAIEKQRQKS